MKDNKTMIVNPLVPAKMVDDSLPSAWSEFNSKYKLYQFGEGNHQSAQYKT